MRWPVAGARRATHGGTPAVPDRRGLVPLWAVRCAAGLIAVLLGALVWNGSGWIVLPVVVAAGAAILPSIGLTALTLLLLIVPYAVNMPAGSPWLLVFVAGLHAAGAGFPGWRTPVPRAFTAQAGLGCNRGRQ